MAFYFAMLAIASLALTAVAAEEVYDHALNRKADIGEDMFTFPLTPPVSVLLPAYNESAAIVESVASLLGLRYPEFEVIVINDGSKDDTLQQVVEAYGLEPLDRDPPNTIETQAIRGIYQSRAYPELIVIDKENGGKADSLNAGINASRYPLVCGIDADSILEPDALLRAIEPFVVAPGSGHRDRWHRAHRQRLVVLARHADRTRASPRSTSPASRSSSTCVGSWSAAAAGAASTPC